MAETRNLIANRYEVIRHIGQGGMADVFLANDPILNRRVAIKILRADLSTDAVSVMRFEREAQAATALAHPNIVEIYDVGDYKGHHYIVMEFVPGKTLKQVIKERGPLLVEEAVDIMKQLASAVAEAHSRGIIHRDIKPQNVIIKADGSVKILDFGIAVAKGSVQLTQANNVMGSVHYLAPELAKGEHASMQSDIYALGIVLFEMLTKDVPYKSDQAVQVALMHMRDPFPAVRSINRNVPQSVENIITKAVAKNPRQRYQTCDEMLRDLRSCLREDRLNEPRLVLPEYRDSSSSGKQGSPGRPKAKITPTSDPRQEERRKERMKAEAKRKRRNGIIIFLMVMLLCLGTFLAGYNYLINQEKKQPVYVPDLEGMTIYEAQVALDERELVLDESATVYELTDNIASGIIISVSPDIGSTVEKGTAVTVTVSSGKGERMPDYVGKNIDDVLSEIAASYPNLNVTSVPEVSNTDPGIISSQQGLASGVLFDPAKSYDVTLIYTPYITVTIPIDIIGMTVGEAQKTLEDMGLNVFTSKRDSSWMDDEEKEKINYGVVIECSPATGTEYTQKKNNSVTLYYY